MDMTEIKAVLLSRFDETLQHMLEEISVDGVSFRDAQLSECAEIAWSLRAITADEWRDLCQRIRTAHRAAIDAILDRIARPQ